VADELPVIWRSEGTPRPWGCILTQGSGYCDSCPAKDVCPHPRKHWSK
jgi:hypothetical protein